MALMMAGALTQTGDAFAPFFEWLLPEVLQGEFHGGVMEFDLPIAWHYRFRFKAPEDANDRFLEDRVGIEYFYSACTPEEWPCVKKEYDIITKHRLEPHLCIGYEIRDFDRKFNAEQLTRVVVIKT